MLVSKVQHALLLCSNAVVQLQCSFWKVINTCVSATTDLYDVSIAKHSHQHSSCISTLQPVLCCGVVCCAVLSHLVSSCLVSLCLVSSCQETIHGLAPIQALFKTCGDLFAAGIGSPP